MITSSYTGAYDNSQIVYNQFYFFCEYDYFIQKFYLLFILTKVSEYVTYNNVNAV